MVVLPARSAFAASQAAGTERWQALGQSLTVGFALWMEALENIAMEKAPSVSEWVSELNQNLWPMWAMRAIFRMRNAFNEIDFSVLL
jgi:hypothetical protein